MRRGASKLPQLENTVRAGDELLHVRRSWPGAEGVRLVECEDSAGRIRAGRLTAEGVFEVLPYAQDPKLPTLSSGADLVVHRAGRRAVTRIDHEYVKHLRRRKTPAAAAAARTMGAMAERAGFTAPAVRDVNAGSFAMSAVPGTALLELDVQDWQRAWQEWALRWPRLVEEPPVLLETGDASQPKPWQVHDAASEADVVCTWMDHLRTFDPGGLASTHRRVLADVEASVRAELSGLAGSDRLASEQTRHVVAHRDLHDGQMLYAVETGRVGLLDFDTAVLADRELDLANLDVHIDLRLAQGIVDEDRAAAAHRAVDAAAAAVSADAGRLDVYRRATWARLIGVYAFRPQWVSLAEEMLARASTGHRCS